MTLQEGKHTVDVQRWASIGSMKILFITSDMEVKKQLEHLLSGSDLLLSTCSQDEVKQSVMKDEKLVADCLFIDDSLTNEEILFCTSTLAPRISEGSLPILLLLHKERQQEVLAQAFTAGIVDFILKPIEQWRLIGRLNAVWKMNLERLQLQKNEAVLNDLLEQFRLNISALKAAAHGIIITDKLGRIAWVNPYFTKLTGYAEHEAVGKNMRILKSGVHPKEFYRELWRTIVSGKSWKGHITNRKKDGTLYHEEMSITPVCNKEGKITHYISIKEDITARRTIEQKLKDDLQVAKRVQQSALSLPLQNDKVDFSGMYSPSAMLGGDMYSWFKIDDDRYGVILLDVMGHGVSSSLVSMSIHSFVGGIITKCVDPVMVMKQLNEHMLELFRNDDSYINHYFTAIYVVIDMKNKSLEYVNAGHPPALVMNEAGAIIELPQTAIPIGVFEDFSAKKCTIVLEGSIQLLLYSDGLLDAFANSYDDGIEKLRTSYKACKGMTSTAVVEYFAKAINISESTQSDDICIVHVRTR